MADCYYDGGFAWRTPAGAADARCGKVINARLGRVAMLLRPLGRISSSLERIAAAMERGPPNAPPAPVVPLPPPPTPSPSTRSTRSASRITPGPDSAGVSNPAVVQHHVSLSPLIFPHLCHQHIHDSWKCCVKHNKPQRMLRLFEDCTVKCLLTYPNT